MTRVLRILMVAALVLVGAAGPSLAQTSPRAAAHDTYGRMVFDWEAPVGYSADVVNNQLVVRFERGIAGDPKVLLKPLAKYLKGATVSPDRKMVTFPLAVPVTVKTFLSGNNVVVDLYEAKATASAAIQPEPKPAAKPATPPAAAPAPAPAAEPAGPPTDLNVRGGEHTGFNRLVFDWPKPVGYSVDQVGSQAVISFDRPANVNVIALKAALPTDVAFAGTRPAGKGTAILLTMPPELRLRHFTSGPRVAVDIVRPAGSPPPPRAAGAVAPPLAPAPGAEEQPPALQPLVPAAKSAAAQPAAPASPVAKPGQPPAAAPAPAPAPAETGGEEKAARKVVSLGVPFDQPTGAAAFRRAGWLWLVFDRRTEVDTKLLKRLGGDVLMHVEQVPAPKGGTALRLLTRPGFNPTIRKEGQLWVFDLAEQPLAPKQPLEVKPQFDFEDRGRLTVAVADAAAQPVLVRDPEVGDMMQVVPVSPIAAGIRGERENPAFEMPATAQGVVVIPRADGVRAESSRAGVEISMPGGLWLSRDVPAAAGAGPEAAVSAASTPSGPLEIARWLRGGADKFVPEHQKLMNRLGYVKPDEKNAQRLEIARHYLANGMPAEALGVLRVMATFDPTVVDTAPFRAVRGAANFLMLRDGEAIEDLSHASLTQDPAAGLWLAAARARAEPEPQRHALILRLAPEEIKGYPARLRMAIGRPAVMSVTAAGDAKAAQRIVDALGGNGLSRADRGTIAYLAGHAYEAQKQVESAIGKYREAEEGESRPDRAYAARARIELQLRRNQITQTEAIRQLERLRFAWRGEDFEYRLLKRLGELLIANGQYGDGLRMLRSIVGNFGENPDVPTVMAMMSDAFNKLYLDGGADKLSPIAAIGLYDEFQELTPSGAKGDEMIRKLADRLAAVDLLDRSAELLRHQVQFRLSGADKARVGARLAFLELADRKPGQALESLDMSEIQDPPAELHNQRRYLRVRALDDLGRNAEALALIINDQSDEARQLRAEIYWGMKKWGDAATALESTLPPPEKAKPLDAQTARRVIDLATALTLARDERGLQRLRRSHGPHMAATEFKEAFDLLTSEAERGIIDYRRVSDKIKQVEEFQTFMNQWRKKIQAKGLSAMN